MINIFACLFQVEPLMRVELMTPSLPRMYSTTELQRLFHYEKNNPWVGFKRLAKIQYFLKSQPFLDKKNYLFNNLLIINAKLSRQ